MAHQTAPDVGRVVAGGVDDAGVVPQPPRRTRSLVVVPVPGLSRPTCQAPPPEGRDAWQGKGCCPPSASTASADAAASASASTASA
ncbi:hypothetical protein ACWGH4_25215, partial [Streptomyces sp. NPDC054847]